MLHALSGSQDWHRTTTSHTQCSTGNISEGDLYWLVKYPELKKKKNSCLSCFLVGCPWLRASPIAQLVKNLPTEELVGVEGDPASIPGSGRFAGEGVGYPLQYSWASLVAQMVKNPPAMWESWVWSLEKGTAYPLQYPGLENSMDSPWGPLLRKVKCRIYKNDYVRASMHWHFFSARFKTIWL